MPRGVAVVTFALSGAAVTTVALGVVLYRHRKRSNVSRQAASPPAAETTASIQVSTLEELAKVRITLMYAI